MSTHRQQWEEWPDCIKHWNMRHIKRVPT